MALQKTLDKAEQELADGRAWRAREILSSSLGTYGYRLALYHRYGDLLLQMGDKMEAGRYLFLSVAESTATQQEAIDLYLDRHTRQGAPGLIRSFPAAARLEKLADYPAHVQARLRELGAPDELKQKGVGSTDKLDIVVLIGCLAVILAILACAAVGVVQIVRWII